MLTPTQKLAMMQSYKGIAMLVNGNYSSDWLCQVETEDIEGLKLTINKVAASPDEAVDLAYDAFCRITGQAPELLRGLPAPLPADAQEADHMVATDDGIPF